MRGAAGVLWLEVTVDELLAVQVVEHFEHLGHDEPAQPALGQDADACTQCAGTSMTALVGRAV